MCKTLGRLYSPLAQAFLSYDFTFLALVKLSLADDCPSFKKSRCHYNPLVKCNICVSDNNILSFCADAVVIISYYKVMDDLADRGALKKLRALLCLPFIFLIWKKARKRAPGIESVVSKAVEKQKKTEALQEVNLDMAAEPSAGALSEILAFGESDEAKARLLRRLGYLIGRWIYIVDAVDDLEADLRKQCFNPFAKEWADAVRNGKAGEFEQYARSVLNTTAGEAVKAFELLEVRRFKSILENILYDGLAVSAEQAICGNRRRCREKPV